MPFPCHAVPLRVQIVFFPFDLHSAAVFDSHIPRRTHAAPVTYHDHVVLESTSQGHGTARHGHGMCELASAVQRRHVGDLPAFGFFRLPSGVPRRLLTKSIPIRKTAKLAVRIFPATTWTITKNTALSEHGREAAWHVWINAACHGRGTAWERQGRGMACVN
jgi:hypothetical protein